MSKQAIEVEADALLTVLRTLSSLDAPARTRVLQYAAATFGAEGTSGAVVATPDGQTAAAESLSPTPSVPVPDIRTLKEEKRPANAVEMAAVVAYYLAELAASEERADTVNTAAITKYFKQAGFRLPGKPANTLPNAKAAGYFELSGRGLYKLNPVGHNLVAHSLPRTGTASVARKKTTRSKPKGAKERAAKKPRS